MGTSSYPRDPFLTGDAGLMVPGRPGSISQKAPAGGHFPERLRDKGIRKVLPSGIPMGEAKSGGTQILEKVIFSLQFLPQPPD